MLGIVYRRLLYSIPVIFLVSVVAFFLLQIAPGDPAQLLVGPDADPKLVQQMREQLGLNDPIWVQYLSWLKGTLSGDLGTSIRSGAPVTELIGQRLPVSFQLGVMALFIMVAIGLPLGVISAVRRGGLIDSATRLISLLGISTPGFVFGILCILVFGWWIPGILPYYGFVPFSESPTQALLHTLLPAASLAVGGIGLIARLTRGSMLESMSKDYILGARSLGIPERVVIWNDALRNALIPVVTVVGLAVGYLLGGSVVIETVFGVPGLGLLMIQSFTARDYPVVVGVLLLASLLFIAANILVDLMYAMLDPKVRRQSPGRN